MPAPWTASYLCFMSSRWASYKSYWCVCVCGCVCLTGTKRMHVIMCMLILGVKIQFAVWGKCSYYLNHIGGYRSAYRVRVKWKMRPRLFITLERIQYRYREMCPVDLWVIAEIYVSQSQVNGLLNDWSVWVNLSVHPLKPSCGTVINATVHFIKCWSVSILASKKMTKPTVIISPRSVLKVGSNLSRGEKLQWLSFHQCSMTKASPHGDCAALQWRRSSSAPSCSLRRIPRWCDIVISNNPASEN